MIVATCTRLCSRHQHLQNSVLPKLGLCAHGAPAPRPLPQPPARTPLLSVLWLLWGPQGSGITACPACLSEQNGLRVPPCCGRCQSPSFVLKAEPHIPLCVQTELCVHSSLGGHGVVSAFGHCEHAAMAVGVRAHACREGRVPRHLVAPVLYFEAPLCVSHITCPILQPSNGVQAPCYLLACSFCDDTRNKCYFLL